MLQRTELYLFLNMNGSLNSPILYTVISFGLFRLLQTDTLTGLIRSVSEILTYSDVDVDI